MTFGIIVDWYGPFYDLQSLKQAAKDYAKGDKVLYMGIAKNNVVKYIGLSTSASSRFNYHHKLTKHEGEFTKFFIGNIESQGISGAKVGRHPKDLKLAEHMLINVLYPEHNKKSKDARPETCGSLYSRFYTEDENGEYNTADTKPLPKFPVLIGYNSYNDDYEYSSAVLYA